MTISPVDMTHDRKDLWSRILATTGIVAVYALSNFFLRIHLPGVSDVDLRPQIVLLFVAGYLYGPWYGFAAGFAGNFCTDLLLGHGLRYLPSWTIGNGLIGTLICFYPYRTRICLERIGQLVWLVLSLILANTLSLTYAAGMETLLNRHLPSAINFRYFYVPALVSNVLATLILFPVILFGLGRLKGNFPVKLALANYYLTVVLLVISWAAFIPTYRELPALLSSPGMDTTRGDALVDAFSQWSLLLVVLLILSFVVSSWMSKVVVTPLKRLEETVLAVLRGESSSAERLALLAGREDEVGILSYTVRLLSLNLWETQRLFRDELKRNLRFIDAHDSGTDILVISLLSFFGREAVAGQQDDAFFEVSGELSNLEAICLVVSAGGLKELAAAYSDVKIEKSFDGLDLNITGASLSREQRQVLAVAVDVNLLFWGRLKVMDLSAPLNRELAFHLLERINAFRRCSKNYVGYVTESDIVGKIQEQWENAARVRSERLEPIMNKAIGLQVINGYQVKNLSDLACFDPYRTIAYSHSNFKHIKQLIALLMGEALQAKLQLEPKWSSFRFLSEWDQPDSLHLESIADGTKVAHMDEFDLVMEFVAPEHRDRFRQVIDAFAKREFMAERKILYESWYQPLFRSDVPIEGYNRIADILLRDREQVAHVYVRQEGAAAKVEWFKGELQELEISIVPIWVNDAFFRYLNGGCD